MRQLTFRIGSRLLLAGALACGGFLPAGESHAAASLVLDSATAAPGQEAVLRLSINREVSGLCGIKLTLLYEESEPSGSPPLTLIGPGEKRLAPPFEGSLYGASGYVNPETGLLYERRRHIAIAHGEPVDGPAGVIDLPFGVPDTAGEGTVYTVRVEAEAYDSEGSRLDMDPAAGTILVDLPDLKPGDVNGNGEVEVGDAVLILRSVVGIEVLTPEQAGRADLDKNQLVQVTDAVAILRQVVGLGGGVG